MRNAGSCRGWRVVLILLAMVVGGGSGAWAHNGVKESPAPGASGSPTPPKFNVPIPVSHDARGVKLPYFDQRGRLQMFFNIAKAYRADLQHLQMENAYMQTYDEKQAPDANVYMTFSVLDLDTRIVTSDVPVTVRRSDFEIIGQKMVFNTQTRVGHMSGHVRMLIFNREAMSSPKPSPGSSPAPAAPPATPQPIK